MKIRYYLSRNKIENLYCRLTDGNNKVIFSLGYAVDPKHWSAYNEEMRTGDRYREALWGLRRYLANRYQELKSDGVEDILEVLKNEVNTFTKDSGIQGISRKMFDYKYGKIGVPGFDDFCLAFEEYTGLTKKDYWTRTCGSEIIFHTDDEVYLIHTYEGKLAELESMFASKSYMEIGGTESWFWKHIFHNRTISRTFISEVLLEWTEYWDRRFQEVIEKGGKLSPLEKMKEHSWKQFEKFRKKYNQNADPFLAAVFCSVLNGIVIYVRVKSSDMDEVLSKYCVYHFLNVNGWLSLFLNSGPSLIHFHMASSSSIKRVEFPGVRDGHTEVQLTYRYDY